ncbi:MAG: hypothetical protein ABI700_02545 [Chloroflexota bacterium]
MEEIFPGLTREWIYNERVVSYTLFSPQKSALLAWSESVLNTLEIWPREKPYLAIHDISQSGIGLFYCAAVKNDIFNIGVIPEAHKRVNEILVNAAEWQMSLALVVSGSLSGQLSKLLFNGHSEKQHFHSKAFFFSDMAQSWLVNSTISAPVSRVNSISV